MSLAFIFPGYMFPYITTDVLYGLGDLIRPSTIMDAFDFS